MKLLGKKIAYPTQYRPDILVAIPRAKNRILLNNLVPFYGYDLWNIYEVSCLLPSGKPVVYIGEIVYEADSANILESKSLKLYFNSLNNHVIAGKETLSALIERDLTAALGSKIIVRLYELSEYKQEFFYPSYFCLDYIDQEFKQASEVDPTSLRVDNEMVVEEDLYSNLLKSNCLITGQPDWGSIFIKYKGAAIDKAGLLQYIISYRNHAEFHEHCVERIFCDIWEYCAPRRLTIYARYTRRGGIDINPYRSNVEIKDRVNKRLIRQ